MLGRHYKERFCAFCSTRRVVYMKRHVGFLDLVLGSVLAFLVMVAIWQGWDARVIPMAIVVFGVMEVGIQIRWRMGVVCPRCGFDPVLYMRDSDKAANRVRTHLERLRAEGNLFLPPIARPRRESPVGAPKTSKSLQVKQKGRFVERQI